MSAKRIKATLVDTYEDARFEERRWVGEAWQLPADAASYERMVEQVARAIDPEAKELCEHFERRMLMGSSEPWFDYRKEAEYKARAALRAIGITQPKKGTK